MKDYKRLISEAWEVATLAHQYQTYDIFPYTKHLRDVVRILEQHGFVNDYIIAGILHDVIEDCNISYSKIKRAFGLNVAEMVYAVTDPKGRTRKDKKKLVYDDIRAYPKSIIIKLADRIANIENSIIQGKKDKLKMYAKESDQFKRELLSSTPEDGMPLWETLENSIIKAKSLMDVREEIHTGLTKEQAYKLMEKGAMIAHEYFTDDEYLYMVNGIIMDENGYNMGNRLGDFWQNMQKWETGWMTANAR